MKFTCQKSDLVRAIQIISKGIASNPQNPILSGVYLETDGQNIELRATDHEIGVITSIPADIEQKGSLIIPGKMLQDVSRFLPGETASFFVDIEKEGVIYIQSGTAKFELHSLAGEFPSVRMNEILLKFTIKDNILRNIIKKTAFAVADDDKRPIFTGCLFDIRNSEIVMAATNTHHLAVQQVTLPDFEGSRRMVIPAKVLLELSRMMTSEIPQDIEVCVSDTRISFSFDDVYIISRLIEGQFPDYNRVVPTDFKTRITINTDAFTRAVERVGLIARHDDYKVMKFEFAGNQVKISASNQNIGYAEEFVPVVIDGSDITISFNCTYLINLLKNLETKEFYFSFNEKLSPASIKEPGNENFVYVITPVRTH